MPSTFIETARGVSAEIGPGGRRLRLRWQDGALCEVPARWLFDHTDGACDPANGQRGHGGHALEAARLQGARIEGEALVLSFAPGGEARRIGLERLRQPPAAPRDPRSLWLTPGPVAAAEPVAFDAYLADDRALFEAMRRVARWGIALLGGAGDAPDVVARAVARFGYVRETNYGRFFDVRVEPRPGHPAYTEQALELHADNPYRDPAPTLQLLHAIAVDGAGGGESRFVDGVAHAEAMRREAPDAFERLARTPVRFGYRAAAGDAWTAVSPIFRLGITGAVEAVRLNHRSLDLALGDPDDIEAWYEAYLAYHRRVHAPGAGFVRRLAPGDLVIFDNTRLLHGRTALAGSSPRWLRGCYADADGLHATLARLAASGAETRR